MAASLQILVVDDELNIRKTLAISLEADGHKVVGVGNPQDALAEVSRNFFDAAFVDLRLGTNSGLQLLPELLALSPWTKVVVITAFASIETAVEAIQKGASDYLPKPFTPAQVKIALEKVARLRQLDEQLKNAREILSQAGGPELELKTKSLKMQRVLSLARQAAASEASVLIRGENGTGKGVLARAIHQWSPREGRAFTVVSCPSLSPELLESELFGHVKGAYTGAVSDHTGRIAAAKDGTLFMDEIGELPLSIQPKLLRFLQDKQYERVGENVTRQSDARILAATNLDLDKAVAQGRFREDLYYRLNVIQLELPPLRERPEDIQDLAENFLSFFSRQNHRLVQGFSSQAMQALKAHAWPGNIRELRNAVERAVILSDGPQIEMHHLPSSLSAPPEAGSPQLGDPISLEQVEELHLRRVLARAKSMEEASDTLGIDTATLWRKRKKLGL